MAKAVFLSEWDNTRGLAVVVSAQKYLEDFEGGDIWPDCFEIFEKAIDELLRERAEKRESGKRGQ